MAALLTRFVRGFGNRHPLSSDEIALPLTILASGGARVVEALVTADGRHQTTIQFLDGDKWLMTFVADGNGGLLVTHAQAPDYRRMRKDERFPVGKEHGQAVAILRDAWQKSVEWYAARA